MKKYPISPLTFGPRARPRNANFTTCLDEMGVMGEAVPCGSDRRHFDPKKEATSVAVPHFLDLASRLRRVKMRAR
jgi:hypothetical protein